MNRLGRVPKGLAWRSTVAALLTGLAFWFGVSPVAPRVFGFVLGAHIWHVLEAPVAGLNVLLPVWAKTAAASSSHFQLFPTLGRYEIVRYMAIGVPAYLVLLYFPVAVAAVFRRFIARPVQHGA